MKILLLSDLHLVAESPLSRTDSVLDEQERFLNFIGEYCNREGIGAVVQAGDFCDVRRSWWLLQYLTDILRTWKEKGITVYAVLGQHDSYYHNMDVNTTVMGVLVSAGLIVRLTAKPIKMGTVAIYGSSFGEKVPAVESNMEYSILAIHKQILMKKFWKDQSEYEYAPDFLHKHYDYDLILCGDAHQRFAFQDGTKAKRIICNTGPMMRLIANEHEMRHMPGFFVHDTDKKSLKWIDFPAAKLGEDIFTTKHLEVKKRQEELFTSFMEKVSKSSGRGGSLSFDKMLRVFGKEHSIRPEVMQIIYDEYEKHERVRHGNG